MNCHGLFVLCGIVILTCLLMQPVYAVVPLWTEPATTSGELSGIVISEDGSTIVAGGDQLIALSRTGNKLWTGWSGSNLAISRDGSHILASRDRVVRMISGTGTILWESPLDVPVTEEVMMPDASLVAAGGGGTVRLISASGAGIRQNISFAFNHFRLFPEGDELVLTSDYGIQTSNLTLYSEWADTNMTQDLVEVAADGSSFVSVTNNRVRMYTRNINLPWDSATLQWDRALPGGNALAFAYSADGSTIVVGRDDNTVQALDHNGTLLWTAHAAYWVTSVAASDDGNTIVAGSMDKTIAVYDRAGTKLGSSTVSNPLKVHSVAVSGDGSVIAAVDGSAVYGFSRSQFMQPETTAVTTAATTASSTTPVPTTPSETTPPLSVPSQTGTRNAALSPADPVVVLVLLLLCRSCTS